MGVLGIWEGIFMGGAGEGGLSDVCINIAGLLFMYIMVKGDVI